MIRTVLATLVVIGGAVSAVDARPAHKHALAQYFGVYLPKKLNDCRTCHLPDPAGAAKDDEADKPHNAFGAKLKATRIALRKMGKSATIEASLEAMLDDDTDGDGVGNRIEILTGHFPGDKDDRPSADELAKAKSLLVEFAKLKSGYPWRPFESVERPAVPSVKNAAWVRNPIDAFLAAEHEALGLKPRPEAPPEALLRRAYLDLIGLPPTPAEIENFIFDCGLSMEDLKNQSKIKNRKWTRLTTKSSIACSTIRGTASAGAGTGWTSGVTAIGPVMAPRCATASRTSGAGATGSSRPSTPTRATIAWSWRCWPA